MADTAREKDKRRDKGDGSVYQCNDGVWVAAYKPEGWKKPKVRKKTNGRTLFVCPLVFYDYYCSADLTQLISCAELAGEAG